MGRTGSDRIEMNLTPAEKRDQLREALKESGLSLDWDDWRDSQGFGSAVREAAAIK